MRTGFRVVLSVVSNLMLWNGACWGEPPAGTDLSSPEHAWWECHTQPKNDISCCSEADGHSLSDREWGAADNAYWVVLEGKRIAVPADTILKGDKCGPDPKDEAQSEAKVWYIRYGEVITILCFEPGTEY